jgi:NADH:ubiquinone reductase (H+-translocating)
MKHVVIAGAGFGGIMTALALEKNLKQKDQVEITVIDRKPYQTAHTYLYEVATSPEELSDLTQLKQSVAIPVAEVFAGKEIKFKMGSVKEVDPVKKQLLLEHGNVPYDYLVLALGSSSNFYNIPGAEHFSLPLKSVNNALAIRNRLQFAIQSRRLGVSKENIRVVVAGGGFAGVEIAAELARALEFICWKENYAREKIEVLVVEGAGQLMPGLDARLGRDTYERLKALGVQVRLSSLVAKVDEHFVEFSNTERLEYDVLIWTAGVRANQVLFTMPVELDRGNRLATDSMFRLPSQQNIFAIGDECCFLDNNGKPLPGTAQQAIAHGKYVGRAIARLMQNQQPENYQPRQFGYIVPLGGKWAILMSKHLYLKGFIPYLIRQYAWFRYFRSILGWYKALRLSILENQLYSRND